MKVLTEKPVLTKLKSFVCVGYLVVAVLALSGCASRQARIDHSVDQIVAEETPTSQPGELALRGFEAWASSAEIDLDQKSQIWAIQAATARDAVRIRNEITMTKSALFKELAKGDFNLKLVDGFKDKIVKLDRERLDLMFAALDKVEDALGKGPKAREYYRYLDEMERRGFDRP